MTLWNDLFIPQKSKRFYIFLLSVFTEVCFMGFVGVGVSENISSKFIYCWLLFCEEDLGGWFPKLLKKSNELELLLTEGFWTVEGLLNNGWFLLNPWPHSWLMFTYFFWTGFPDIDSKGFLALKTLLVVWNWDLLIVFVAKTSLLKWFACTFTE